jgi:hypothetical protein
VDERGDAVAKVSEVVVEAGGVLLLQRFADEHGDGAVVVVAVLDVVEQADTGSVGESEVVVRGAELTGSGISGSWAGGQG